MTLWPVILLKMYKNGSVDIGIIWNEVKSSNQQCSTCARLFYDKILCLACHQLTGLFVAVHQDLYHHCL